MSLVWGLGWVLVNSLWGGLPFIPAVRRYVAASPQRQKWSPVLSGVLAFLTGAGSFYWLICRAMVGVFAFYARNEFPLIQGLSEAQVSANLLAITNQVMLRSTLLGQNCLLSTPTVCEISRRVVENGFNPANLLLLVACLALIPALIAVLVNQKLTTR